MASFGVDFNGNRQSSRLVSKHTQVVEIVLCLHSAESELWIVSRGRVTFGFDKVPGLPLVLFDGMRHED